MKELSFLIPPDEPNPKLGFIGLVLFLLGMMIPFILMAFE